MYNIEYPYFSDAIWPIIEETLMYLSNEKKIIWMSSPSIKCLISFVLTDADAHLKQVPIDISVILVKTKNNQCEGYFISEEGLSFDKVIIK